VLRDPPDRGQRVVTRLKLWLEPTAPQCEERESQGVQRLLAVSQPCLIEFGHRGNTGLREVPQIQSQ
jgi:hypothetical protein